ncbi:SDR family NAD(P)-dependent oxidoreductase [Pseudomonas syringae pv. maculicola]|nr:SDR family NAD(P)-dependent oxidoreductase [Pseudomonas syringae pv. maculicola]
MAFAASLNDECSATATKVTKSSRLKRVSNSCRLCMYEMQPWLIILQLQDYTRAIIAAQPTDTFVPDLAVNIGGALAATQAILPAMAKRAAGTILHTGGGFALYPSPDFLSLSTGKAGIRALVLGLFESAKAKGVHIGTVTVAANVAPDSKEADAVAEHFWKLHSQPVGAWEAEANYSA